MHDPVKFLLLILTGLIITMIGGVLTYKFVESLHVMGAAGAMVWSACVAMITSHVYWTWLKNQGDLR